MLLFLEFVCFLFEDKQVQVGESLLGPKWTNFSVCFCIVFRCKYCVLLCFPRFCNCFSLYFILFGFYGLSLCLCVFVCVCACVVALFGALSHKCRRHGSSAVEVSFLCVLGSDFMLFLLVFMQENRHSLSEGGNFAQRERSEGAAIKCQLTVAPGCCFAGCSLSEAASEWFAERTYLR